MEVASADAAVKSKTMSRLSQVLLSCCVPAVGGMFFLRYSLVAITDVLEREFDTTSSGIGLLASITPLSSAIMLIPVGLLLEEYAVEVVIALSLFGMALSCLIFALSKSYAVAIFSRIVLGVFSTPIWVGSFAIVANRVGNAKTSSVWGVVSFAMNLLLVAAISLQAVVYSKYNRWRVVFYFMFALFAALSAVIGGIFVYEGLEAGNETEAISIDSEVRNGPRLTLIPLKMKPSVPVMQLRSRSFTAAAFNDSRVTSKTLDKSLLAQLKEMDRKQMNACTKIVDLIKMAASNPQNWWISLYGFGNCLLLNVWGGMWLTSFLVAKFEYSKSTAAFLTSLSFFSSGIGCLLLGYLSKAYKRRVPPLFAAIVFVFCVEAVVFCPKQTHIALVSILLFISGLGLDPNAPLYAAIREHNWNDDCVEVATSLLALLSVAGVFVSQALGGLLLDLHWKSRGNRKTEYDSNTDKEFRVYAQSDYWAAFYLVHTALFCLLVSLWFMKETFAKNVEKLLKADQKCAELDDRYDDSSEDEDDKMNHPPTVKSK